MIKYIIVFSYFNNVTTLQDGRHSEPLFEKMTFHKQIFENGEIPLNNICVYSDFIHANLLHKSWSISFH